MEHFIVRLYVKDTPPPPSFSFLFSSKPSPVYLAGWEGDPGRTHSQWNAKKFETKKAAQKAIDKVLKDYPDHNYSPEILTIETTTSK